MTETSSDTTQLPRVSSGITIEEESLSSTLVPVLARLFAGSLVRAVADTDGMPSYSAGVEAHPGTGGRVPITAYIEGEKLPSLVDGGTGPLALRKQEVAESLLALMTGKLAGEEPDTALRLRLTEEFEQLRATTQEAQTKLERELAPMIERELARVTNE